MRCRQRTAWSSSALWDAAFVAGSLESAFVIVEGGFTLFSPYCDSSLVHFSVFLDGSVFGFIDEFVANVLCSLLASPVYVMVRLAENFSEHFDRTRVAAVRRVRIPS